MADPLDAKAQKTLAGLSQRKAGFSRYTLLVAIAILVGLCAVLSFVERPWSQHVETQSMEDSKVAPRLVLVPVGTASPPAYIKVQTGIGKRDDLFFCEAAPTVICDNLTQSPALTEKWPALDVNGAEVAYYGVGEGQTELFRLSLTTKASLPITVRSGASNLHTDYEIASIVAPAFSPSGLWVAFPAQAVKGDAIELFVAKADGQNVRRVTDLGYRVSDYIWLDDQTLVVAVHRIDGMIQQWKARLEFEPIQLEPLP